MGKTCEVHYLSSPHHEIGSFEYAPPTTAIDDKQDAAVRIMGFICAFI